MTIQSILMEQSDLLVRRIREGTVIDHIDEGRGLQVLSALGIRNGEWSIVNGDGEWCIVHGEICLT